MTILNELKSNDPTLLVTDELLTEQEVYQICNGKVSPLIQSSKAAEFFALYDMGLPKSVKRLSNKCTAFIVEIMSESIRVFVPLHFQVQNNLRALYPGDSDDSNEWIRSGTEVEIDIFSDEVANYTVLYFNSDGLQDPTNALTAHKYVNSNGTVTHITEIVDDFDADDYDVLDGVDLSNYALKEFTNLDDDNTTLMIVGAPNEVQPE